MPTKKTADTPLVGIGFDVHALEKNRPLILGGVNIPYEYGLKGHSDADVLLHSIIDAILGAVGMGDIGVLFPDTNPDLKDISSLFLLKEVLKQDSLQAWKVSNIDCTIIAQKPALSSYIPQMKDNLTGIIKPHYWLNIKATTTEKLGFTGRGEGIAAYSSCLLIRR